jgi:DNA polymerase-3 subunit alpha
MSKFVHLHVHTHFSMLDGMGKIPDLVKKAKEYDMPALAITDHGVMHGAIEFYEECVKQGIKPIIGVEAYVAPRTLKDKQPRVDQHSYHLILLAKNEVGYRNLLKLVTIAHLEGYYYKPRIDKETLKKYSEGLIACSACIQGEIPRKSLENYKEGKKALEAYLEIFSKDDLYLEVQHHPNTVPEQKIANENIYQLAKEYGLKVVATNDPHYVNSDDNIAQDALICLQTGRQLADTNRMSMTGDDYSLLTPDEMADNFKDHPEVLANTLVVADKCNLTIELGKFRFPEFPLPEGETYETYLRKLIDERLPNVVKEVTPEIQERIDYEFKVIKDKGYLGYFLIVQDFFQFAKTQQIPTNTRGSAAGCFISYVLGISGRQLNPLEFNLPFERFLNPYRPSAPDIDADIADTGREAIIQYVSEKYGKDHVAQIITFGTMAARMAVRDVGRVLGMTYSEVDIIAKLIPPLKTTLQQALDNTAELRSLYKSDPKVKECIDIAQKLEGVVRHASVHAAGVVIAPEDITNYTPVMMDAKGERLITQYEMHAVGEDGVGLIKMDFLGLANLSIIQNVLRIVRKTRGIDIVLDEIPLDDKKAFSLLSKGETIGVFQLESEGMRKNIKELKPTTIFDIMAMVALYRPGPMSFIPEYIARKHDPSKIKYLDPRMEKFLDKSLGLIVYQDDVLMTAIELAGYNWEEVDKFRKAIGKKIVKEMAAQKEKFYRQIIERGMEEGAVNELWSQIETFAGYGFNKAHAASYGLVAYQTAYLKSNYPPEYMSALMTSNKDDLDKIAREIEECARLGIEVLPPSVVESFVDFGVVKDTGNIRYALSGVKNVGQGVAEEIVEERKNGPYKDLEDFLTRLSGKVINKKSLESLVMAGAFDELGERGHLLYNIDNLLQFATSVSSSQKKGLQSLFGGDDIIEAKVQLADAPPATKKDRLDWERTLIGICISENPLGDAINLVREHGQPISSITEESDGKFVRVAGVISSAKKILTRANQSMLFVKLEDQTKSLEIIVFPRMLEASADKWQVNKIVAVDGFVNLKDNEPKVIAENVWELTESAKLPAFIARKKGRKTKDDQSKPSNPSQGNSEAISSAPTVAPKPAAAENLTLTLPDVSDKNILLEIREILEVFPGSCAVCIKIPSEEGTKEIKVKNKVEVTQLLKSRLAKIIGRENVFAE